MALSSLGEIRLPQKTWNQECFHAESTRIISSVIFPCFTVIFAIQDVLRSAGDTMDLLWLSLSSLLSLSAFSFAYLLAGPMGYRQDGIWMTMLASSAPAVWLNWLYYKGNRWQKIRILKTQQPGTKS